MRKSETLTTSTTDESVSFTVIQAVADANGVDPVDLDERLHDCVDPDALDRLFESGSKGHPWDGRLSFRMADCRVEIEGSGRVAVTPLFENSHTLDTVTS